MTETVLMLQVGKQQHECERRTARQHESSTSAWHGLNVHGYDGSKRQVRHVKLPQILVQSKCHIPSCQVLDTGQLFDRNVSNPTHQDYVTHSPFYSDLKFDKCYTALTDRGWWMLWYVTVGHCGRFGPSSVCVSERCITQTHIGHICEGLILVVCVKMMMNHTHTSWGVVKVWSKWCVSEWCATNPEALWRFDPSGVCLSDVPHTPRGIVKVWS